MDEGNAQSVNVFEFYPDSTTVEYLALTELKYSVHIITMLTSNPYNKED